MNAKSARVVALALAGLIALFVLTAAGQESKETVRLNMDAFRYAQQLIAEGRVTADGKGAWAGHHPSTEQENEFIRKYGISEYARWHLGIDVRHAQDSKARYKFPYGDFESIHRCGLMAVKSRARQYGYAEIEGASRELLEMINSKKPRP